MIKQVHIYANDAYVKGENLYVLKVRADAPQQTVDEDSFKYQIKEIVPISNALQNQKIFSNGISPMEIFRNRLELPTIRDTFANAYATAHMLASYSKNLVVWMDGHACKQL